MACQAAIILSGEETELTCICVVAKTQNFQNRLFSKCSLEGASQAFQMTMFFPMVAFAAERRVTDRQTGLSELINHCDMV
jgi:hypothetical protein